MPDVDVSRDESRPSGRGKGRGGNFFAVDRGVWEQLWVLSTANRLNFVITYLVLSAGTGSDHQLSKWSTKACERHTGLGKPRAKAAVDELIQHGLVQYTERSTKSFPQYRLQAIPLESDPIFLPVAIVIGVKAEASVLRRVREAGDALLLRMLVDLYGLIQIDATFGVPVSALSQIAPEGYPPRNVFEIGVHAIWALRLDGRRTASGEWTAPHQANGKTKEVVWENFWARVAVLERIGAIWYEPWIFESEAADAEPMFPVDLPADDRRSGDGDVYRLTRGMNAAAGALSEERSSLLERYEADILVPLALHRQAPGIRGVARMRVEADTPGRRLCYLKRRSQMETYESAYLKIVHDALSRDYHHPMNTVTSYEI